MEVAQQAAVLPLLLQRLGCGVPQSLCGLVCAATGPRLSALSGRELADLSLGLALAGHAPGAAPLRQLCGAREPRKARAAHHVRNPCRQTHVLAGRHWLLCADACLGA